MTVTYLSARRLMGNTATFRNVAKTGRAAFFSTKPASVETWEKLADKELGKSKWTVESMRTDRVTPEGIAIQPVYWDVNSDNPEMPGVYPYTRGPYATMYCNR